MNRNTLEAITDAVRKALPVVPVLGKRPAVPWQRYINDPPTAADLQEWQRLPDITGLALVLGPALWKRHAFLWALDIEAEHRAEAEAWLDARVPGWREGLVVETGGGGLHVYFLAPGVVHTRRTPWGEVRGAGALCVLPPSHHPETGRPYRWLSKGKPLPLNPGDTPGTSPNGRMTPGEVLGEPIREGMRNQVLTSIAGSLRARGADQATLEAALLAINQVRCDPPLPDAEVRTIARSVAKYPPGEEGTAGPDAGPEIRLVRLSEVQAEPIRWLWPGRIPLGKLTVLDGDPGLGKSLVALDLAARVSQGRILPDGSTGDLDGPAGCVLLCSEDDPSDTIKPRLLAAGADCTRIALLQAVAPEGKPRLPTLGDIAALERAIAAVDARLVVVDPLMAYLGRTDAHVDAEVRPVLARLAALAQQTGAAIVCIRHLNKTLGGNPLYRGGGSIAFIAAARSGLLVAPDPEDPDGRRRVLAVTKSNLSELAPSLVYTIEAPDGVARVAWLGRSPHTARSLLAVPADTEERTAVEEAKAFLREILADGPRPASEVKAEARAAGITDITLRRAKLALGVHTTKQGFGPAGTWCWSLPKQPDEQPKMLIPQGMSILGGNEHLRSDASLLYGDADGPQRPQKQPDGQPKMLIGPKDAHSPKDEHLRLDARLSSDASVETGWVEEVF